MSVGQPTWVLASDIDNTLTGARAALRALVTELAALRRAGKLFLALSTGRRLGQVLAGVDEEDLPQSDAVISQVGTEIYLPPFKESMAPLPAWERRLRRSFSRQQALTFLQGIDGLQMQPEMYNTPLKVSAFLDQAPRPEAAVKAIRQRIKEAGAAGSYQVIWSSGRDLDIIPAAAGKGNAIRFLLDHLQLEPQMVIVAGDSGNDRSMFEMFEHGIIVANAQPELRALRQNGRSTHYMARRPSAAGVREGLRHFGVLDS
ncbi:MAG TPA: HAD-IIB family hydrolase [Candidatus Sulfomarinibacteraceae bacterium]|nr:HAD-IIB family hydrolase [Candidatus Sulfomarinibacteraceae bacterium]